MGALRFVRDQAAFAVMAEKLADTFLAKAASKTYCAVAATPVSKPA